MHRPLATLVLAGSLLVGCGTTAPDRVGDALPTPAANAPVPSEVTTTTATTTTAAAAPTTTTTTTPTTTPTTTTVPVTTATTMPSTTAAPAFDLPDCPDAPRGAVADKVGQRFWLCRDGVAITDAMPMTTASANYGLPPVGTYPVFAREENAFGIHGEPLERFVAFYTTSRGNRIAFHEVVNQDPSTVGDLDQRGASSGCFRILEDDSYLVWDYLQIGDPVVVSTN